MLFLLDYQDWYYVYKPEIKSFHFSVYYKETGKWAYIPWSLEYV